MGKKALEFLIAHSGSRRNLEVDFFGGEPLMNWEVVKRLVEYGRSREREAHKKRSASPSLPTACWSNDEVIDFCNREMHNVVLSLDGRREVHDRMRRTGNGNGAATTSSFPSSRSLQRAGLGKTIMCGGHLPAITWILPRT